MSRHPWYSTSKWQKRRAAQLRQYPLCRFCQQEGVITRATTADHITPHKGDYDLFWYGELQSLCSQHHNSTKKKIEIHGYDYRVGADGIPIDPDHPFRRK